MIIHSDHLRRFPDTNRVFQPDTLHPEFYMPRANYVYEVDLYTFNGRNDRPGYLGGRAMKKIKKALVSALQDRALNDADFATTFWISRYRITDSIATDPIYIASMVDLQDFIYFDEIAFALEEHYDLEEIQEQDGGFLREVEAHKWRDSAHRVEPWVHVEQSEVWFPCSEHKWFLWDNKIDLERHEFGIYEDWEWDGKIKFSRQEFIQHGIRNMMPYGDEQHTQAELFYVIEKLLARVVNHPHGKISVKSLKFQLHQDASEKVLPMDAIPTTSEEWVPLKINCDGNKKSKQ
ncbi:hypothetical protein DN730_00155 [Marinomonas piezotolerans]|uniref:Uncharacterized protein n=1 Tax=Marinomonas piezotolerans TaxID=2213058 RepID=A0A370UCH6_9GAMM|nr:hypothetical protein [Marinomonas piezotolerans]RDL45502.1 hypothetical protein DN730_00155 [Marinomonas piezotolerans]